MIRKQLGNCLSYLQFEQQIQNSNGQQSIQEIKPNQDQDIGQYLGYYYYFQNECQLKIRQLNKNTYEYLVSGVWQDQQTFCQQQGSQQVIQDLLRIKEYQRGGKSIKITYLLAEEKSKYVGQLTNEIVTEQSKNLLDTEKVFEYIKQNIENLEYNVKGNSQITTDIKVDQILVKITCNLNLTQLENEELLNIQIIELKKIIEDQAKQISDLKNYINQEINIVKIKQDLEKVQNDLNGFYRVNQEVKSAFKINDHPTNIITCSDFHQNGPQYQSTTIYENKIVELQLKLNDDDTKFTIIILQDGDRSNLDVRVKAFYFSFPSGKYRRGNLDECQITKHPFKRKDNVQLKVDPFSHFIIVKVNNFILVQIKIPREFSNFAFLLKYDDEEGRQFSNEEVFKTKKIKPN